MITLLFFIIAFALRKRYLPENPPLLLRFYYYGAFIVLTPILGILIFRNIDFEATDDNSSGEPCGFPIGAI